MLKNKALAVLLVFCFLLWLADATSAVQVDQEWVPYIPPEENVELKHWISSSISYINVSITFPHPMFNVSSWGDPIMIGNSISVDAEIWEYTGPTMPVTITIEHIYELGTLFPGEYIFTFMAWGQSVKSITFKIISHDIAITNFWTYKNIVGRGVTFTPPFKTIAYLIVNVTNEGDCPEVFNLTVFEGIEPAPILIERWPDPDGSYSDMFWRKGDINRDGYIDNYDRYIVLAFIGWTGPLGKHPADVDCDGKVEFKDLWIVTSNFNKTIWDEFGLEKIIQDFAVVSLNSTDYEFIGFRWNTTETSKGNYTFSAYAWPVSEEEDIENNRSNHCWIYVGLGADVNVDEIVDMTDIGIIIRAFGTLPGNPKWNPNLDLNDDIIIDMTDIGIALRNFCKKDP